MWDDFQPYLESTLRVLPNLASASDRLVGNCSSTYLHLQEVKNHFVICVFLLLIQRQNQSIKSYLGYFQTIFLLTPIHSYMPGYKMRISQWMHSWK